MSAQNGEYEFLSFRAATKRVGRHRTTLWRWVAEGMRTETVDGAKYVELDELLAWYRRKILAQKQNRFVHGKR